MDNLDLHRYWYLVNTRDMNMVQYEASLRRYRDSMPTREDGMNGSA